MAPLDELRERLGINEPEQITVGPLEPASFDERRKEWEKHMKFLSQGGADKSGYEAWQQMIRGIGR